MLNAHPPMERAVFPQKPLLFVLSVISFGIMSLWLPKAHLCSKVLYTGLGFALILLAHVVSGKGIGFVPPLLLILVIRSCLIFNLTGRLIVSGMAFSSFTITLPFNIPKQHCLKQILKPNTFPPIPVQEIVTDEQLRGIFWHLVLHATLLFGLVLGFVLLLTNALLAERQSREKLAIAHQQLRQYALRVEDQATLQERNRIAREIHDALGHLLTAQSIQLENALVFVESNLDKAKVFLEEAKQLGRNALAEVRQSVSTLRSDPMQGKSLDLAIALLIADFQRQTNMTPEYTLSVATPLSTEMRTTVYRIIQEALTNISKHSQADEVRIKLRATAHSLYLTIEDNGRGFNPYQNTTGFGIQGMRERTLALGGQFQIVSEPKAGCRITAVFPCRG
jgi:signal transduction histidine kinase